LFSFLRANAMSTHHFLLPLALACASLGAVAQAQQVELALTERPALSEVVVTSGSFLASPVLLKDAQSIGGNDWLMQREATLGDSLKTLSGVSSSGFGPNASRPVVRGLDGDRVHILQNGASSFDLSGLSPDHAVAIDPLNIEKVELLRGAAALLYGAALDGVVNVQDARIARQALFGEKGGAQGKADWGVGGAAGEHSRALQLEAGDQRLALHADAFARSAGDTRVNALLPCTQNGVSTSARRICNSDAQSRGQALGASLLFDQGYVGASWSDTRNHYGTVAEDEGRIGLRQLSRNLEWQYRPKTPKPTSGWGGFGDLGAWQSLRAQWSQSQYAHTEFDAGVPKTQFGNLGQQWRLEAQQRPKHWGWGVWAGTIGWQLEQRNFSATGDEVFAPNSRTRSQALFAHQSLQSGVQRFGAGARLESVGVQSLGADSDASGGAGASRFTASSRRFAPWSVALDAERRLPQGWRINGGVGWVQRAPKDYELFADGAHFATAAYVIGAADLEMERFGNINLGAQWGEADATESAKNGEQTQAASRSIANAAARRDRFALNVYRNHYTNYIAQYATGYVNDAQNNAGLRKGSSAGDCGDSTSVESACRAALLREYAYRGVRARVQGLGLGGNLQLSPAWDWLWRVDAVQGRNLDSGEALPRLPPLTLAGAWIWSNKPWQGRFGFERNQAQREVPIGDQVVAGYTLWHAALQYRYQLPDATVLSYIRLNNITDQVAYSATSTLTQTVPGKAPLAGRSLRAGVQVVF
jgi:iron complex outermembrane recepter protein